MRNASPARATRADLYASIDRYLAALRARDPTLASWAQTVRNTENNVELEVGDGLWGTITELGSYDLRFADVERGLVLAAAFIDHRGRLGRYTLTDGTEAESPVRRPHSFYVLELFKIKSGAIEQIEANFITVPYHMPSPWESRD